MGGDRGWKGSTALQAGVSRRRRIHVVYGPGSLEVAHAVNEFVSVEEVITATKTYALAVLDWCGVV